MTGETFQQFGNKYTLQSLIGVGGMAEVYKAKLSGAEGFEKLIVIKKLFPQFAKDPEIVGHFIAEAKLAALLQHENITQVYDFGELDGSYFIAMEYLAGRDLHSVIQRSKESNLPVGLAQALFITARVCEGMAYAHDLKDQNQQPLHLIHRDLSPHNVFITWEGRVKIIDFGIARADLFDNKTKVGMAKGKVSYMSPEQLGVEQVDHRSDIFAIGILLYEMLSGRRMYSGDTATLIRKCMSVEYERLESVRPGLPRAIYAVLGRALAREVDCRYQRCADMQEEIEETLYSLERRPSANLLGNYMRQLFADQIDEKPTPSWVVDQPTVLLQAAEESSPPPESWENVGAGEHHGKNSAPPVAAAGEASHAAVRFGGMKIWSAVGMVGVAALLFLVWPDPSDKPQDPPPAATPVVAEQPRDELLPELGEQTVPAVSPLPPIEPPPEPLVPEEPPDEIAVLLDQAGELLGKTPVTVADLDQAQDLYYRVQEKEPDNWEAGAGIARIGEHRRLATEKAMKGGNFPKTTEKNAKGMFSAPKDDRFQSLQGVVGEKRQKTVKELLARADQAMAEDRYTTPKGNNAYHFYREVLALESKNVAARQGMVAIAERYADMADAAFREMRLPTAGKYCRQGLAIDPLNSRLLDLQRDLGKSKPQIFIKSIEKSFNAPQEPGKDPEWSVMNESPK